MLGWLYVCSAKSQELALPPNPPSLPSIEDLKCRGTTYLQLLDRRIDLSDAVTAVTTAISR